MRLADLQPIHWQKLKEYISEHPEAGYSRIQHFAINQLGLLDFSHDNARKARKKILADLAEEKEKQKGLRESPSSSTGLRESVSVEEEYDPHEASEVTSLRAQIRNLKSKIRTLEMALHQQETFRRQFLDAVRALPLPDHIPHLSVSDRSKQKFHAVLLLSDHHAGQVVNRAEMEGFNEYNFDVFANRMWFLTEEVAKITRVLRAGLYINELHVFMLGDMGEFSIHEELEKTNQFPEIPNIGMSALIYAQALAILTQVYPRIHCVCIVGNHGRLKHRKYFKHKYNNYDWAIYQITALMLREYIERGIITFEIPHSPATVTEVNGWKFLLSHGDEVRGWGGWPEYGIRRREAREQLLRRHRGGFDYWCLGHWHSPRDDDDRRIVNGSLIGPDEYSKTTLGAATEPMQMFFLVSEKYGKGLTWALKVAEANYNEFTYDPHLIWADQVIEALPEVLPIDHIGEPKKTK